MAKKPAAKSDPHADPLNRPVASEETPVEAAKPAKASGLVRMVRGESYPAPHEADVHPDMVDDYVAGGWEKA